MELERSNETLRKALDTKTSSLFDLRRQSEAFGLEEFRLKEKNSKLEEVCGDLRSQNEELQNMLDELRSRQIPDEAGGGAKKPRRSLAVLGAAATEDSLDSSMPLVETTVRLIRHYVGHYDW